MKLTSIALALLALAAGLVIAGCGDDEDDEPQAVTSGATGATGEGGATTKAAFISAADEICREADDDQAEEGRQQYPEGPPTGDDAATFGEEVVIPSLERQYEGISALPVPEGEEDAIEGLLTQLRAAIDELKEDPGSFVSTDAFEEVNAAAKDYGFKECGGE